MPALSASQSEIWFESLEAGNRQDHNSLKYKRNSGMARIGLFLGTNSAIIVLISLTFRLLALKEFCSRTVST